MINQRLWCAINVYDAHGIFHESVAAGSIHSRLASEQDRKRNAAASQPFVGVSNKNPTVAHSSVFRRDYNSSEHANFQSFTSDEYLALVDRQMRKHIRYFPKKHYGRRWSVGTIIVSFVRSILRPDVAQQRVDP